jgi:hypothetical protein
VSGVRCQVRESGTLTIFPRVSKFIGSESVTPAAEIETLFSLKQGAIHEPKIEDL